MNSVDENSWESTSVYQTHHKNFTVVLQQKCYNEKDEGNAFNLAPENISQFHGHVT